MGEYFTSDVNDYEMLSPNASKISEWKYNKNMELRLSFNTEVKAMSDQLHDETSHETQKIKKSRGIKNVTFDDLVQIKYGVKSELMKSIMNLDKKSVLT